MKKSRPEAIKELLNKHSISDQKTLVDLLKSHHKIDTNQAVVSRELRKLGVIKKQRDGMLTYELPAQDVRSEILKLAVLDIQYNEVMIVIETHPGLAPFVGDAVDQSDLDIIGCLAGENAVFVSPKSIKNIHKTFKALCEVLHFKKHKE